MRGRRQFKVSEKRMYVYNLREFVSANERHPESVRVFPWLRPAAGDSIPGDPGDPGASLFWPGLRSTKPHFNLPRNRSKSKHAVLEKVKKTHKICTDGMLGPVCASRPSLERFDRRPAAAKRGAIGGNFKKF